MQMRMVLHLTSPGMEDSGKSRQIGADEPGIFSQLFYRFRGSLEHGVISGILV
jgi:hypothetical protein